MPAKEGQRREVVLGPMAANGWSMVRANFWSSDGKASSQTFMLAADAEGWLDVMAARDGRSR